ncbi:Gfo/Idh/MocA family oxidoreductase [Cetobacterium sp. 8H]|uniref:Gfo/Idh/MocA family protein n=1 Tax=Cetobacterium sp. 8H TaxID=2759681 RepID=UPI00163B9E30|nr:Gfo/Idh/MocA family oxidoreductase [Cetobacterium sp. 8H]MBC2850449.1 Gfo/Idh/MocA family oxidoreductase [Cetobacterium sp. 8H]
MIKIGIIGTSKISNQFVEAALKIESCSINMIYSRNYEKGKIFGEIYGVKNIVTSIEELGKSDLDMIYIASPNSIHFSQVIELLKAKKNILCEKPMGISEEEVNEMFRVAYENNVTLMEAMKNTFLPNFKAIQKNLYKIGEVRGFIGNFSQYSSRYTDLKNGDLTNIFDPKFGGGAHLDIGVYPLYFALRLFGIPKKTVGGNYILNSGVPGIGSIILEYKDMIANIFYSKITNSYIGSEIQGEKGSILIDSISNIKNIRIIYHDGSEEGITVPQLENSMIYELEAFLDLLKQKKVESDVNTWEISKNVIKIITK